MMHQINRVLINLLFGCLFVILFFAALEIIFKMSMKSKRVLNEYQKLIEEQGFTPNNKAANERRIFLVGESTVRGVPYTMEASMSGFLIQLLKQSGNENVRVINTGIPGRHSFYQREEGKTLMEYKADAVILYAGNNDTRDFANVMRDTPFAFLDFKLTWNSYFYWQFKRRMMSLKKTINKLSKREVFSINYNQDDVWHWTDAYLKKKKKYLENPKLGMARKMKAVQDYERNLSALTQYLAKRNINVYVCALPIVHKASPEIGDWSRKGYQFEQRILFKNQKEETEWRRFFEGGRKKLEDKQYQAAIDLFLQAKQINSTYPLLMHNLGVCYEALGDHVIAKQMYVAAKDLQIQSPGGDSFKMAALKTIATQTGAHFVDTQTALEETTAHGIIGMDLFLDHCHPNTLGHKVIASRMMSALCETGFIKCKANQNFKYWLEQLIGGEISPKNLAQEFLLVAFYHFNGTLWDSKPDYVQAVQYLEKAKEIMPENKNLYPLLAASYWNLNQKDKSSDNLKHLAKLDQNEYQKTLNEFPYLKKAA